MGCGASKASAAPDLGSTTQAAAAQMQPSGRHAEAASPGTMQSKQAPGVLRLFHGTTASALGSIQSAGHLQSSTDGFFGPGVYLTSSREKAAAWARFKSKGSPTFLQSNGWGSSLPEMPQPEPPHLPEYFSGATEAPVVVEVQVDIGCCKAFDMTTVNDADYFYYIHASQSRRGGDISGTKRSEI